MIYIHIYLHFKINPLNELSILTDKCKQEISNTCYYKLPFIINDATFINTIDISNCTKYNDTKCNDTKSNDTKLNNIYIKEYDPIPLLEPYVKFFTNNTIHKIKKNKIIDIHSNLECRNFYIVHKGIVEITCIHPKYKDHLNTINENTYKFIENHSSMIHLTLHEKEILFLPNYWYIYVKSNKNTIIEHIKYSTILNNFTIYWHKYMTKYMS
jgi:hypothetical protein